MRKTSRKFEVHYVKTAFDFLVNCLLEKGKYFVIESYFSVGYKNKVLLIYCSFSFFLFLKDKKLKKLAVALKLLAVLSLNSVVFG